MKPKKKTAKKLVLENYQHPDAFGKWLGFTVLAVDPQKMTSRTSLKIRYDHLSPAGRVHGGVISAFFDIACATAIFPTLGPKDFCSTVELKVNYFRPIDLGDVLTAESQIMFHGKRLCVVHSLLYRKGMKQPVAMATGTYNLVLNNS
ncbi:MAG: PaaI family thioesterase [Oligoflexia bacterium]|nr:PaaI family thioesterase [Oligoflexia bacterium]